MKARIPVAFYQECGNFPECGCMLVCDAEVTDRARRANVPSFLTAVGVFTLLALGIGAGAYFAFLQWS